MPPIGETLREARMRQRLDIAEVEERTKIRAKYLRALENEEWGLLPGPTFVKTFLRTYAEAVGVDPYLLVEEYRVSDERGDGRPEFQPLAPLPARDRRDRRGRTAAAAATAAPRRAGRRGGRGRPGRRSCWCSAWWGATTTPAATAAASRPRRRPRPRPRTPPSANASASAHVSASAARRRTGPG